MQRVRTRDPYHQLINLIKEKKSERNSPAKNLYPSSSSEEEETSDADPDSAEESSSSESQSGEEDNPADDARFIEVISKKLLRKNSVSPGNHLNTHHPRIR